MTRRPLSSIFSQQKVLCCYVVLSLWIFTIIIGVYKYLGVISHQSTLAVHEQENLETSRIQSLNIVKVSRNGHGKLFRSCAPVTSISLGSEGSVRGEFSLEGIVVVFRHGDRGPVNHVRNLETMQCYNNDSSHGRTLNDYISFISSQWLGPMSNSLYQFAGPANPHVPVPKTMYCELGQLTVDGVMQHVRLGSLLRSVYFKKLFNESSLTNNVFAYTTKYRRTFQSLSAFLYGFLEDDFRKIPLQTVSSIYFCFEDCACPAIDVFAKAHRAENSKRLKSYPALMKLVEEMSSAVYTMSDSSFIRDPHYLKDALLAYICHNKSLPCVTTKCVSFEHVMKIFSYVDWDVEQFAKSIHRRKVCFLNTYGLLKNIVSHLLKIVSHEKPRIILYSAHDKTMANLLTTLGILSNEAITPSYASRVIFEVYARKEPRNTGLIQEFLFRVLFNGKDITARIKFCGKSNVIIFEGGALCSFESLIRFLHDDYFSIFNSVNFKEACAIARA